MKFSCELKQLCEITSNLTTSIKKKINPIPVLEGILLNCEQDNLILTTYDLNFGITGNLKVQTKQEGKIVINSSIFSEILRKMKGPLIEINSDDNLKVIIKDNETTFELTGINAEEFPKLPIIENVNSLKIESKTLKRMIYETLFSASPGGAQNPILCGTLFEISDEKLKLVALDGFRVAISEKEMKNVKSNFSFVVNSKTLGEIFKLLSDEEENFVEINVSLNNAVFRVNEYLIFTKLLEGSFIEYESAIPKNEQTVIEINPKDLAQRIERVSVMVFDRVSVVMEVEKDKIILSCISSIGSVNDVFAAKIVGEPLEKIAFNNRYILDALKHAECENVKITLNGPLSPIKITSSEDESFIFLVLPVRLR